MFSSNRSNLYQQRRHSFLRGPLTVLLILWAIAFPGLILLLTGLGPIGILLSLGAVLTMVVPWLAGLLIIGFLRWLT